MTKHTLFLDFDGPVFPNRYIRYHSGNTGAYPGRVKMPDVVDYWVMDPLSVEMLNNLHSLHPFQTVVSSSWRKFIDKEQCQDLFHVNGLNLHLADDWCSVRLKCPSRMSDYSCYRASEIKEYVDRNEISDYIILDDIGSGHSLSKEREAKEPTLNKNSIVLVDEDMGISSHNYKQMFDIVRKWAGIKPSIWENMLW